MSSVHQFSQHMNCDQCEYRATGTTDLVKHILGIHKKHPEMIKCQHCDYSALTLQSYNNHLEVDHVEFSLLGHLIAGQKFMTRNNESFKEELTNVLDRIIASQNQIINGQNSIKQELFILRQDNQINNKKLEAVEKAVDDMSNHSYRKVQSEATVHRSPTPTVPTVQRSSTPTLSLPRTSPSIPCPSSKSESFIKTPKMIPSHKEIPKILFIGDSIATHADLNVLTDATRSKIVTAKAYSAVFDEVGNIAKDAPYYPQKNFMQVIPDEASKELFEHIVVQTGTVDISNLKTNVENPEQYLDYYKQEAVQSATNIFNAGIIALEHQPSIKSIIFMKQTPRYDPPEVDPLSIKAAMSHLFNNTLMNLWINSPMKDKIFVRSHNIDCSGAIQAARYRHTRTGRFDSVHLYGTSGGKAYTQSVINILKTTNLISKDFDFHLSCPQTKFQNRHTRYQGN